jgi:hypothetical protein
MIRLYAIDRPKLDRRPHLIPTTEFGEFASVMFWFTLILPLAASAAILEERQTPGVVVEELKPQFRKDARRTLTRLGRKCFL